MLNHSLTEAASFFFICLYSPNMQSLNYSYDLLNRFSRMNPSQTIIMESL